MSTERRIICVHGFSRGGTNLLWNLLTSHPAIISPERELNQLVALRAPTTYLDRLRLEIAARTPFGRQWAGDFLSDRAARLAHERATTALGQARAPNLDYSDSEADAADVCVKLVSSWSGGLFQTLTQSNRGGRYIPALLTARPSCRVVHLVRSPEAQCNSWMRRGASASASGRWYQRIFRAMLRDYRRWPNQVSLARFDDIIATPVKAAESILAHLGYDLPTLEYIRLREKPTLAPDGTHRVRGETGDKRWIHRDQLTEVVRTDIDEVQASMLTEGDRTQFWRHASPADEWLKNTPFIEIAPPPRTASSR